ncbi:MAG: HU family DNA-binding protein, partial [Prevotella sp.]|nr:HU family DNA-binding protein [Prevotella sp.]
MNTIKYSLAMQGNPTNPEEPEKAYARVQLNEIISTQKFINHISEHNGVFSKGTVKGVTTDMVSCLREMLVAGNKVIIDGLGEFSISLSSVGAESMEKFTASNIKSVNLVFKPAVELQNLIKDATFTQVSSRKVQAAVLAAEKK